MKLSILLLALENRPWRNVYDQLWSQVCHSSEVELLVEYDRGEKTSGQKRFDITQKAMGDYVCFVDDDDQVSSDYVKEILEGCKQDKDVITFCLEMTRSDRPKTEIWRFGLQTNQRSQGKMMVNHLCAWRRETATRVSWCPDVGYADDQLWMQPLYHAGLVQTEYHLPEVLYHYQFSPQVTQNQKTDRMAFTRQYVGSGLRCFKEDDELLVEVGGLERYQHSVVVRDRNRVETLRQLAELQQYHVVQVS